MKTTCCSVFLSNVNLFIRWQACEQALWHALVGGWGRKESLQLHLRNLNICIEKVNAKCWLAEMTLVMTSLLLAHVFQSLFTFELFHFVLIGGNLTAESTGRHRGIGGRNSNSRDVVASSPSFSRPIARVAQRACSQAISWQNIPLKFQLVPKNILFYAFWLKVTFLC